MTALISSRRLRTRDLPAPVVCAALILGSIGLSQFLTLFGDNPTIPWPVLVDALIGGLVSALLAVAIVLIYRANKMLTFAHGSIVVATGTLAYTMLGEGWSYWVVAPLTLAAGAAASALIEATVMRRFATSPRLVATIASLAAGQVLATISLFLPGWRFDINIVNSDFDDLRRLPNIPIHFPNAWAQEWFPLRFTADHVVAGVVAALALGGVGLFLRYTTAGTAIRGASENSERVALLGISMGSLGTLVWVIAGLLAALTTLLGEPLRGGGGLAAIFVGGGSNGISALLRGFAAGVFARMERVSVAVSAAIAITFLDKAIFRVTTRGPLTEVALFAVIAIGLLVQRRGLSRVEESAATTWAAAEEIRPVPHVLSKLPSVQTARRWAYGAIVVATLGFPFAMSPSQVVTATTYAIYGIVLVSLVVLTGWGGQISLGQFALVAVGASVSSMLQVSGHLPFPLAMLLGGLAAAGVAIVLGLPALRIKGLYLAVTTLAFGLVMFVFFLDQDRFPALVPAKLGRPELFFLDFADDRSFFFLCALFLVLTIVAAQGLRRSRTGRVLIAARDNEAAVQALGISLIRTRLATFVMAGFIAGVAGALLASQQQGIRVEQYHPGQGINMFLMAIIGGLGSVGGVVMGAVYLGTTELFLDGQIAFLLAGLGVLVVLLAYPSGLGGLVFAARDAFLRRVAIREKIYVRALLGDVRDLDSERSRAQLAPKPAPEPVYEIESHIREAGASQRSKGWVYG